MSWEWRAFVPRSDAPSPFAGLDGLLAADLDDSTEARHDVYVLADGLGVERGLKLRGGDTLELKLLGGRDGHVERWDKRFVEPLEAPSHRTRELARLLAPGAPVPVRPLRSQDDVLRLVRDLRLGEPRAIVVRKEIRAAIVDPGVRVEQTLLRVGARALETVAVEGADPGAVRAMVARLGVPAGATVASVPALLARGP